MSCAKGLKVVSTLYFSARVGERSQSRIFTPYFSVRVRKNSKSYPHFNFLFVCEKIQSYPHFTFQLVCEKELKVESSHFTFQQFYFLIFGERTQSRISSIDS